MRHAFAPPPARVTRDRAARAPAGRRFALRDHPAAPAAATPGKGSSMNTRLPSLSMRAAALAAAALLGFAASAQARNVRLMEPVPDARTGRAHEILGTLDLRFGGASARGADVVRRDVAVKGVGSTRLHDVGEDDKVRPSDHDLCARAFEDALTQLAFAARGANATAIVGVVSNYDGKPFDDPAHFECHVGALKAAVELKAQIARGVAPAPVLPPPAPMPAPAPAPVPIVSPPTPQPGDPVPPADSPPTFQPLPPNPPPAPN